MVAGLCLFHDDARERRRGRAARNRYIRAAAEHTVFSDKAPAREVYGLVCADIARVKIYGEVDRTRGYQGDAVAVHARICAVCLCVYRDNSEGRGAVEHYLFIVKLIRLC